LETILGEKNIYPTYQMKNILRNTFVQRGMIFRRDKIFLMKYCIYWKILSQSHN